VFAITALYYIVYQNWASLTDFSAGPFGWVQSVVFTIGNALVGADKTIEIAIRRLAAGTLTPVSQTFDLFVFEWTFRSPELAQLGAALAIVGALSTLLIYARAGHC